MMAGLLDQSAQAAQTGFQRGVTAALINQAKMVADVSTKESCAFKKWLASKGVQYTPVGTTGAGLTCPPAPCAAPCPAPCPAPVRHVRTSDPTLWHLCAGCSAVWRMCAGSIRQVR